MLVLDGDHTGFVEVEAEEVGPSLGIGSYCSHSTNCCTMNRKHQFLTLLMCYSLLCLYSLEIHLGGSMTLRMSDIQLDSTIVRHLESLLLNDNLN